MANPNEFKDYRAELNKERQSLRWASSEGERQWHREYKMPESPRALAKPQNKPVQPSSAPKPRKFWPF